MVTGDPPGTVLTERLRLEPITPDHAGELWLIHNDDAVAPWYRDWQPTPEEATEWATMIACSRRHFGVHKWVAYHRETGHLVGRGGPSPTPADDDWGRVNQFLPPESMECIGMNHAGHLADLDGGPGLTTYTALR